MKLEVGDGVVMRDEAFSHFEDYSELQGVVGEVIHISINEGDALFAYTLKFELPKMTIITKMPHSYLQIPGRA